LPHRAEVVIERAILLGKNDDVLDRCNIRRSVLECRRRRSARAQSQFARSRTRARAGPSGKGSARLWSRRQYDSCSYREVGGAASRTVDPRGSADNPSRGVACALHRELDGSGGTGNARYPA
jgi:hypothetical protein